jgi:hypothetical protein
MSSYGRAPGRLDYPHGIAIDPNDASLYVVEIRSWRVQKLTWATCSRMASPQLALLHERGGDAEGREGLRHRPRTKPATTQPFLHPPALARRRLFSASPSGSY